MSMKRNSVKYDRVTWERHTVKDGRETSERIWIKAKDLKDFKDLIEMRKRQTAA